MILLASQLPASAGGNDCRIIKKIALAHCQRGPARCAKCREMSANAQYSLLDLCPQTPAARRVTEVIINGQKEWREFDVVRSFGSLSEARAYAETHNILIVSDEPTE